MTCFIQQSWAGTAVQTVLLHIAALQHECMHTHSCPLLLPNSNREPITFHPLIPV